MQKQQNPLSGQVDFKTLTKLTNLYQIGIADIIIRNKEEKKRLKNCGEIFSSKSVCITKDKERRLS